MSSQSHIECCDAQSKEVIMRGMVYSALSFAAALGASGLFFAVTLA